MRLPEMAGVARGPAPNEFSKGSRGDSTDHTTFPVRASRAVRFSAFWPGTRVCKTTKPPATTGELCASATAARQRTVGAVSHGAIVSVEVPSRRGPSHPGQSSAGRHGAAIRARARAAEKLSRRMAWAPAIREWFHGQDSDCLGNGAGGSRTNLCHAYRQSASVCGYLPR